VLLLLAVAMVGTFTIDRIDILMASGPYDMTVAMEQTHAKHGMSAGSTQCRLPDHLRRHDTRYAHSDASRRFPSDRRCCAERRTLFRKRRQGAYR
jgi:hypothetical protein